MGKRLEEREVKRVGEKCILGELGIMIAFQAVVVSSILTGCKEDVIRESGRYGVRLALGTAIRHSKEI